MKTKEKKKKEKPQYNMWQNSAYMMSLAWKSQKSVIILCIVLVVIRLIDNIIGIFMTPTIIKKVEIKSSFQELILTIIVFTTMFMLVKGLSAYLNTNTMFGRIQIRSNILEAIHVKLCTTSYPNAENPDVIKKLDRASMAVNGNNSATEAIWNIVTNGTYDILCFIVAMILLTVMNPLLMIFSFVLTLIGYFTNKRINEWGFRHRDEESSYTKRMNYIIEQSENISLAKDIRIFGMRTWLDEVFQKTMRLYKAFSLRAEKVYIWTNVIDVVTTFLKNGLVYVYLIGATLKRDLPASEFLLYYNAIGDFTRRIGWIMWNFETLHQQSLDICVIREFLDTPEPFLFKEGKPLAPICDNRYELRMENVTFRYPEAEEDTIKNMNLTIHPGEKLAIVGLNGAGKTTLVKLLCGFYDPTEGRVLLNGEDIRQYNREDYYKHFSAVFQQFSVLEAPLTVNISQKINDYDENKIWDCLKKSGLEEKVKDLKDGISTPIGRKVYEDGVELSGGQMQRMMLSRALYKDAPIIVLDEPTAALDPIAESDMYQKYNKFSNERTSIYISHRLASTRFCDRIIYLENGSVMEEGTHNQLLKLGKKYADLFRIQSKYYQEGEQVNEA